MKGKITMCGRFSQLTIDDVRSVLDDIQESIATASDAWDIELASIEGVDTRIGAMTTAIAPWPDEGALGETDAPIPASGPYGLHTMTLTWGFPASWATGKLLFNTRIESATGDTGMWPPIAAQGRCLVPALGFWETNTVGGATTTSTRRQVEFMAKRSATSPDSDPIGPESGPAGPGSDSAWPDSGPASVDVAPLTPQLLMIAGVMLDDRLSLVTTTPDTTVAPIHDRMPLCLTPAGARLWLSADWRLAAQRPTAPLQLAPDPVAHAPQQMSLF